MIVMFQENDTTVSCFLGIQPIGVKFNFCLKKKYMAVSSSVYCGTVDCAIGFRCRVSRLSLREADATESSAVHMTNAAKGNSNELLR